MPAKRSLSIALVIVAISTAIISQGDIPSNVVAKIGDRDITIEEINSFNPEMSFQFRHLFDKPFAQSASGRRIDDREKEKILEQNILQRLLVDDARAQEIHKDPQYLSMMAMFESYILLNIYYDKVIRANIQPSEEQIREEYDRPGRFTKPASAKVVSIWSKDEASAKEAISSLKNITENNVEQSGFRIEEMHILDDDKSMQMQHKASTGGNANEPLDPMMQIMLALPNAKVGDIIGPKGRDSHYITVKVLGKTPAGKIPFEDAKEQIIREYVDREFNRALEEKQRELRRKAVVTIYYENLDKAFE